MTVHRYNTGIAKVPPALFERVAKGDQAAFEEVHTMYKARLAYYLKKIMEDWQDVEDVVSDTFVALWKRKEHIESDQHLKNFLFVAARNKAFNLKASQSRQQKLLGGLVEATPLDKTDLDPELVETEMIYMLYQAVETLPAECRRIFELSWEEQLGPGEIAKALNINPATVRSQKRRAIQLIKDWISKNAPHLLTLISLILEKS